MQTVIGLFDNDKDADKAVQELYEKGFSSSNVDVSSNNSNSNDESNMSDDNLGNNNRVMDENNNNYNTPRTSLDGLGNNTSDNLTGASYENRDITEKNRTSDLSDKDENSFGGKVSRFFKNLFGDNDNDTADRYSNIASKSKVIVTVHAQSAEEAEHAADILDDHGAVDMDERAQQYGYTGNNAEKNTTDTYDDTTDTMNSHRNKDNTGITEGSALNVIKEDVKIGKKQVETGGMRLRSRIVERPVEEQLRLREERIVVDRNTVDRQATTADMENFKEGEIEMTSYAEVADISKEARVVEEVKLSREVDERKETVNEIARDTEVEVEDIATGETNSKNQKKAY